jgi:hypothetical protein
VLFRAVISAHHAVARDRSAPDAQRCTTERASKWIEHAFADQRVDELAARHEISLQARDKR